jgi:hypothetical protein
MHALYREVLSIQNRSEISVKILPEKSLPFSAQSSVLDGKIQIAFNRSINTMLGAFVFELCNLKQQREFVKVLKGVEQRTITTADQFAKSIEEIEYKSCQMHHQLVQEAMMKNQWDASMDLFGSLPGTFRDYWKEQKHSRSAEVYREEFMRIAPKGRVKEPLFARLWGLILLCLRKFFNEATLLMGERGGNTDSG